MPRTSQKYRVSKSLMSFCCASIRPSCRAVQGMPALRNLAQAFSKVHPWETRSSLSAGPNIFLGADFCGTILWTQYLLRHVFPVEAQSFVSAGTSEIQCIFTRILLKFCRNGGHKNLVDPRVRKLRWEKKLKQKDLAARLELAGWQLDRAGVSKVESRFIKVSDYQMLCLMHALSVDARDLLPVIDPKKPVRAQIRKLLKSTR